MSRLTLFALWTFNVRHFHFSDSFSLCRSFNWSWWTLQWHIMVWFERCNKYYGMIRKKLIESKFQCFVTYARANTRCVWANLNNCAWMWVRKNFAGFLLIVCSFVGTLNVRSSKLFADAETTTTKPLKLNSDELMLACHNGLRHEVKKSCTYSLHTNYVSLFSSPI